MFRTKIVGIGYAQLHIVISLRHIKMQLSAVYTCWPVVNVSVRSSFHGFLPRSFNTDNVCLSSGKSIWHLAIFCFSTTTDSKVPPQITDESVRLNTKKSSCVTVKENPK